MRVFGPSLFALVLAIPLQAQTLFPLGDGDTWTFEYIVDPPFSDPDTVRFDPVGVLERVTVSDVLGRRVARLDATGCGRRPCTVDWDGEAHADGAYLIRAESATGAVSLLVTRAR